MRRNKYFVDTFSASDAIARLLGGGVDDAKYATALNWLSVVWYVARFSDWESFRVYLERDQRGTREALQMPELAHKAEGLAYLSAMREEQYGLLVEYLNLRAGGAEESIGDYFESRILPVIQKCKLVMEFKRDGSNVFDVEPRLSRMLLKTDFDDSIKLSDIRTPFPGQTIYLNLEGCGSDAFSRPSGDEAAPLVGAFVMCDERPDSAFGPALFVDIISRWKGRDGDAAYVISDSFEVSRAQHCMLHDTHPRDFANLTLNDWYYKVFRVYYGDYSSYRTERYEAYKLVVNVLLYLQYQDRDVKYRWPDDIPLTLKKSLQGKKKQQEKAEATLKKRGYSKIHFCGYQMQKEYERLYAETGREVNPHWRRGHWRNQACGPGMKEHKLVWIKPMIVCRDKGEPEYGHIYHVGDTVQP